MSGPVCIACDLCKEILPGSFPTTRDAREAATDAGWDVSEHAEDCDCCGHLRQRQCDAICSDCYGKKGRAA